MISNTCKYAIRAMLYLAIKDPKGERNIGIKEISKELDLPAPFLGKVLQIIAKNKLLHSTKGPNGGFSLNKDPEKISLYDIVVIIDTDDLFNNCLIGLKICEDDDLKKELCPFNKHSEPLRDEIKAVFQKVTIGEFAKNAKGHDLNI